MTAPQRESQVTKTVLKHMNATPGCHARKVGAAQYGSNGEPDIDACINGHAVKIEMKAPGKGNASTPIQKVAQDRWRAAGAFVMVATSWAEVEAALIEAGLIEKEHA